MSAPVKASRQQRSMKAAVPGSEMATALDLRTAVAWIAEVERTVRELRAALELAERRIGVLDRLRPSCAICHETQADWQTARGPACTDCVGDLPGEDDGGVWPAYENQGGVWPA